MEFNYKIRLAKKKDIPEMMRIASQKWKGKVAWIKRSVFEKVLKDNPQTCWIMGINDKIAGFRMVSDDFEHRAWGWLLIMGPEYRREGHGTVLWKETNKTLKKMGYRCILAECGLSDTSSIKWHKKVGYKILCRIPKWFYDNSTAVLFYYKIK